MKRLIIGLAVMLMTITVGCRPTTPREMRTTDFSCKIDATLHDMTIAGELKRYTAGTLELVFEKPETLKGTSMLWNGDTVTLQMYGLSFNVDPDDIPERAIGEELVAVLDQVLRAEVNGKEKDGDVVYEGTVGDTAYTLVYDGESGFPQSLSMPQMEFYAEFVQ